MASNFYNRKPTTRPDGTRAFLNDDDLRNEREVATDLMVAWNCEIHYFGAFSPVDFYATRDGRMVAVMELKTRSHDSRKYSTVFLSVKKWLALLLCANGLATCALFVVRFTDGIFWIPVGDIRGEQLRITGCSKQSEATRRIGFKEPIIEVPVAQMKKLKAATPDSTYNNTRETCVV